MRWVRRWVCETGMPYAKSSESNFEVAGGLIRWIPGMRRPPFELGQDIVRLFFPVCIPGDINVSFYKETDPSLWGGAKTRHWGGVRRFLLLYRHFHCRGCLCGSGPQMNVIGVWLEAKVVRRAWMRVVRGWKEGIEIDERAAKESVCSKNRKTWICAYWNAVEKEKNLRVQKIQHFKKLRLSL